MNQPIIFCLGRSGDCVNALPIAKHLADQGERPRWMVSAEHADIFDGVSYVERDIWPGCYNDPSPAMQDLKRRFPGANIINAQIYRSGDEQRLTSSYQTESFRLAGMLDMFSRSAPVFDSRDMAREAELAKKLPRRPFILVAATGISSPFANGERLLTALREKVTTHEIVDARTIKAHRIYDMLGVMDRAALVVSVDTVFLHLARACSTPVIALINDGWAGSVPPPSAVATFRYADLYHGIDSVIPAVLTALGQPPPMCRVFHVVDMHGESERHQRARATWPLFSGTAISVLVLTRNHARNATQIGDSRSLPFLKDLLNAAMEKAEAHDVILWTNDDVALDPKIVDWAKTHVAAHGAASMRREDVGASGIHMGRDCFAFTKKWLAAHWDEIPSFYLGAPCFDLVLAALIRRSHGLPASTLVNLHDDMWPADAKERYVRHEAHPSAWAGLAETTHPANKWNVKLAQEWCAKNNPQLSL